MRYKHYYKTLAVIVALALNATGLVGVGETIGYYLDYESSRDNVLLSTSLDMTIATSTWSIAPQELDMGKGSSTSRTLTIGSSGNINFDYRLEYLEDAEVSNPALCSALVLTATKNGITEYTGPLSSFVMSTSTYSGADDVWGFELEVPEDAPQSLADSACAWDIHARASQPNFAGGTAYHDEEGFENLVETKSWNTVASTQGLIGAIEDARVDEEHAVANYGNAGTLEVESNEGKNQRSFLKFALLLPPGTAVADATLNIFMTDAPGFSRTYDLAPVVSPWSETGITWATQPGGLATSSSATTGTVNDRWMQFAVGNDVSSFVSGSLTNNGWRLGDREESTSTAPKAVFESSEEVQPELRPYLDVTFTPPVVSTDHLVINEVYYAVDPGRGSDTNNEWVELYNPTAAAIDVYGWQLCDDAGCDSVTIPATIPAYGFAVVANSSSTWALQWPEIASTSAVTIAVGTKLGSNGLRDAGDRVELRNASSTLIDAMSYGDDSTYFSLIGDRQGDSLARIVKGYDTDASGDFVINASPNPGTNPSSSGREIMRFTAEGILVADASQGFHDTLLVVPQFAPEEEEEGAPVVVEESALVPSGSIPEVPSDEAATSTATSSDDSLIIIPGPPSVGVEGEGNASSTEPLDLPTETATTTEVKHEEDLETEAGGEAEEELPQVISEEKKEAGLVVIEEVPSINE